MPVVKSDLIGDAPTEPHLVLITGQDEGMAIPVGAAMCIVENVNNVNGGVVPLVLLKVSKTRLTFRCACMQKGCTRAVKFEAKWSGHHIQKY